MIRIRSVAENTGYLSLRPINVVCEDDPLPRAAKYGTRLVIVADEKGKRT